MFSPSITERYTHHRGEDPVFFRRKLAEHKSEGEAMRALKRQLSNVIYRRLLADQRRREAARGGQMGTRLASA